MKQLNRKILGRVIFWVSICALIIFDVVISKTAAVNSTGLAPDSKFFESGQDGVDGITTASKMATVSIVKSDNPLLPSPAARDQHLNPAQIKAMVNRILTQDQHYITAVPYLKKIIQDSVSANGNCWVAVKANTVFQPGEKYTAGDQTHAAVVKAILEYLADSTAATRISMLFGGSYGEIRDNQETGIMTKSLFDSDFGSWRWNDFFPGLPDSYSYGGLISTLNSRYPSKTIEGINLNYDDLMTDGAPYSSSSSGSHYYADVPTYNGIGYLGTDNTSADNGRYNPTHAVYLSDILVNVPVMKTMSGNEINCVHKNYIGTVSRGVYGFGSDPRNSWLDNLDHSRLTETVVNLFAYHPVIPSQNISRNYFQSKSNMRLCIHIRCSSSDVVSVILLSHTLFLSNQ